MITEEADLWETLKAHIESGYEDEKVEFKATLSLDSKTERAEFGKDVLALANTDGGDGYIVIGVVDARHRCSSAPEDSVSGFSPKDRDELWRQMVDAVSTYCEPAPRIRLRETVHPLTGRKLCVVVVAKSSARPHAVKRASEVGQEDDIWVRRGPSCARASLSQIERMIKGQRNVLIINLAHPLDENQLEAIRNDLNCRIERLIEIPAQFIQQEPFGPQVRDLIDKVHLDSHTWQTATIVVNPPGLSWGTALVLAEIHGRMGHFPTIIRLRPAEGEVPTRYVLAETIDLRNVRDQSRNRR